MLNLFNLFLNIYSLIIYNWNMSYKALYRTYRPTDFDSVVGQDHIVSTLRNIIKNNKIGHAYLFAGPRGTGKTSIAHIFAHTVNVGASGESVYDEMDILEIDAASNNGVPEIRNIINNITYAPTKARYKVYIIDEVHMLTKAAFNALLKTLEEPPKHAIFVLATTEPHKIPITIMSRVQRFNFKRIEEKTIEERLRFVLDKEKIGYEQTSLKLISKLAQGGMRDALSIADQAAAFGDNEITFNAISQVFGVISTENQIKIINYAYSNQTSELMRLIHTFIQNGADIERITHTLLSIIKEYIVYAKTGDEELLSYINKDNFSQIEIDINFAYETLDILMELSKELRFSPAPRQSFELSILKMANINQHQEVVKPKPVVKPMPTIVEKNEDTQIINVETEEITDSIEELMSDDTANLELENLFNTQEQTEQISSSAMLQDITSMDDIEEFDDSDSLEEDILSTQEIRLTQSVDIDEDIDVLSLFNTASIEDQNKVEEKIKKRFVISEIINLLVQADKDKHAMAKANWERLYDLKQDPPFGYCADMLSKAKVISAGKDFLLLSAEDPFTIDGIFVESSKNIFLKLIEKLFGRVLAVYAITKDEFMSVRDTWVALTSENQLPEPRVIEVPRIKEEKTEEQEYGAELFGELFED